MPVRNFGYEQLVNTATTGNQQDPDVAALPNGGYIVTWDDTSTNASGVVNFQRYDAFGVAVGAQGSFSTFTVSSTTILGATHPHVVVFSDGGFAIAYEERWSASDVDPSIRYFDASGNPVGTPVATGAPVGYNDLDGDDSLGTQIDMAVRGTAGTMVYVDSLSSGEVYAHLIGTSNVEVGSYFHVAGVASSDIQAVPATAVSSSGNLAFAWFKDEVVGEGIKSVQFRIFNSVGTAVTGEQTISGLSLGIQAVNDQLSVTALARGYLVTYETANGLFPEVGKGLRGVLVDDNGTIVREFQLNERTAGNQTLGAIAPTQDGGFVAFYLDGSTRVLGRVFDSEGHGIGSEFAVSTGTTTAATTSSLSAATLSDGRIVVTWDGAYSAGPDASGNSVHSQIVDPRDGQVFGDGNANTMIGSDQVNDQISGFGGNDVLLGLGGNDFLIGGDGDDQLYGSAGADNLAGGSGTDIARYDNATSAVTVDLLHPTNNTGEAAGDTFDSIEGVFGGGFGDHLYGSNSGSILYGQGGNDTIYGGNGVDNIHGGAGTDVISGGAGNDSVFGDADNDVLFGYTGIDFLYGGAGADSLNGEADFDYAGYSDAGAGVTADLQFASSNTGDAAGDSYSGIEGLLGSGFADSLRTDGGSNWIFGAGGDDTIFARGGDDFISGDAGNDTMYGEAGNDTFIHRTGDGQDTVGDFTAGAGIGDVLNILEGANFDSYAEVFAAAAQVGLNTVITFAAGDTITLLNVTKTNLVTDDFSFV